jgi:hypothetical protein
MRLSSLLSIALAATAGCQMTPGGGAAYPGAPTESPAEGATESAAPGEEAEGDAGRGEGPSKTPAAQATTTAPQSPATAGAEDRRGFLAGISLAAIGVTSAGMGGFLMGWAMGACDNHETICATRVVLPIVGALSIAGGAIPMAFGVSLLHPATLAPKTGQASPWPKVVVGPAAASATWRF